VGALCCSQGHDGHPYRSLRHNYQVDHEEAPPVALPLACAPTPFTFHIPLRAYDGLFAQPAADAADDAEFDRPRFNDGESHRRRVVVES